MDSHADITCVGAHTHIIEHIPGQTCVVHPFDDSYEPMKNVRVCSAAFAYDKSDGETIILRINQCLDYSEAMNHSLLCTNQVRSNGIIVDDTPQMIDVLSKSQQAIIISNHDLSITIKTKGPVPFIPVHRPTENELKYCECINLTSEERWEPDLFLSSNIFINSSLAESRSTLDLTSSWLMHDILHNMYAIKSMRYIKKGEMQPDELSKLWNIN